MISAHLKVRTLEQAWLEALRACMTQGREYRKDGGSRAGMLRKALDFFTVEISHPEERPLVPLAKPGLISPCTEADAERYLKEYLYNTEEPAKNESYTYAQFLTPLVHATAKHYAKHGLYVQQGTMPVGRPWDILGYVREVPDYSMPCLRLVDTRIIGNALHYYIYFRAWNLFGAFPLNMAGLQMLKEIHAVIISEACNTEVVPGPTVAMSKDCHVNEIEFQAALAWIGE